MSATTTLTIPDIASCPTAASTITSKSSAPSHLHPSLSLVCDRRRLLPALRCRVDLDLVVFAVVCRCKCLLDFDVAVLDLAENESLGSQSLRNFFSLDLDAVLVLHRLEIHLLRVHAGFLTNHRHDGLRLPPLLDLLEDVEESDTVRLPTFSPVSSSADSSVPSCPPSSSPSVTRASSDAAISPWPVVYPQ